MGSLGYVLPQLIAHIESCQSRGAYATAAEDLEQLRQMEAAYKAFKEGKQKECVEAFGAAVAHDTPTLNPEQDPAFVRFLGQALAALEKDSRVDAAAIAAVTAFFCLSNPRVIKLTETSAGRKLDALAEKHKDSWYLQYTRATWRVLRDDRKRSLESLNKALAAGGPCGLYYTRARVYSNMQKRREAAADYAKFLELVPADHRSVPDAHYALALDAVMDEQKPDLAAARRHFTAGQAAEANVAPWVGYQPSAAKMVSQMLINGPGAFQGL